MISVVAAGGVIGAAAGALTGTVALAVQSTPTDYTGIALIIGSVSTLVGTVGGLFIALRRSSGSINRREAAEIARALHDQMKEEGTSDAS